MFSRPAFPTNNFTDDERYEEGEEVGCPGSDDGKCHRQEGKEVPSTKSHQGTAYSLTLPILVCSSKHKQGLRRQLRRNSRYPLSCLVSSSPGGFRSLRVAPIPGLQLPGLELWSQGCWQTVQSLSHGWQCPFPPLRGLSPAPLGKQLRLPVALSPLPAPLRSFSSLNISAALTCACHTDFSTLSTSNIASISKESKGFSESIKVYVYNGIFHSAVFPGTFSLPAGDPELRNDF